MLARSVLIPRGRSLSRRDSAGREIRKRVYTTREKNHILSDLRLQIGGVSHFSNDLGLDSLDTVEVVMAIEEV